MTLLFWAPLLFLLGVCYTRVMLEIMIVVFRIAEHTAGISSARRKRRTLKSRVALNKSEKLGLVTDEGHQRRNAIEAEDNETPMKPKLLWAMAILVPTTLTGFVIGLTLDLDKGERQTTITTPAIRLRSTQLASGESHDGKDVRNLSIPKSAIGPQSNSSTHEAPLTPKVFTGHRAYVKSIAISPDSRRLLSGGGYRDASVRLWDVQTGAQIRKFSGHSDNTDVIVAFTPDPRVVLSAGGVDDFTVRFWNIESGVEVRNSEGYLRIRDFPRYHTRHAPGSCDTARRQPLRRWLFSVGPRPGSSSAAVQRPWRFCLRFLA